MNVQAIKLNKYYGRLQALKNVSVYFKEGVYGLVGPNGAGKSTLIRLLVAAERADSGLLLHNGENVWDKLRAYKKELGYLPQEFGFYQEFTGREMLRYTGMIKTDFSVKQVWEQTDQLLELLDLKEKADVAVGTYSGGMKQRLGIAQAFMGDPKLIILDEATVGLDPMQRYRFKNLLREYGKNKTIILSTHIMSDLQEIADYILFLKKGEMVYEGKIEAHQNLESLYLTYFEAGGSDETSVVTDIV